jgi:aldehyde dehydrogenase (NAD+)
MTAREEIFGPVLCVIPYRDEAEAVEIANDTMYGLQSYVLSSDVDRARRVAEQLQAGRVVINAAPHEPLPPSAASSNPASTASMGHPASRRSLNRVRC